MDTYPWMEKNICSCICRSIVLYVGSCICRSTTTTTITTTPTTPVWMTQVHWYFFRTFRAFIVLRCVSTCWQMSILCNSSLDAKRIIQLKFIESSNSRQTRQQVTSPKHQIISDSQPTFLNFKSSEAKKTLKQSSRKSERWTVANLLVGNPGCDVSDLPGNKRILKIQGICLHVLQLDIYFKKPSLVSPRIQKQIWGIVCF